MYAGLSFSHGSIFLSHSKKSLNPDESPILYETPQPDLQKKSHVALMQSFACKQSYQISSSPKALSEILATLQNSMRFKTIFELLFNSAISVQLKIIIILLIFENTYIFFCNLEGKFLDQI